MPKFNWAERITQLNQLHELARNKEVGYEIIYEESPDTFYVTIRSAAPAECITTKSYGLLENALDVAIKHLESL